jgi:phosphoglycerate dehydrogenase-like enzyme
VKPRVAVLIPAEWRSEILDAEAAAELRGFAELVEAPPVVTPDDLPALLADVDAAITGWGTPPLRVETLTAAPRLRMIAHTAGTVKSLLPREAIAGGLLVSQSTANLATALAEHVVAQVLLGLQYQHEDDRLMRTGGFADSGYRQKRRLLGARTVGIWGMGRAGRATAHLLRGFGCEILAYDPVAAAMPDGVAAVTSLAELFERSEVLVMLAPLLPQTHGLVDAAMLKRLCDGSVLVNAGRGALLDEAALLEELGRGRLYAALDVFATEPLPVLHPLRGMPNTLLTPHVGGHTRDTHRRQGRDAVAEVRRFLSGEPLRFAVTPAMMDSLA